MAIYVNNTYVQMFGIVVRVQMRIFVLIFRYEPYEDFQSETQYLHFVLQTSNIACSTAISG